MKSHYQVLVLRSEAYYQNVSQCFFFLLVNVCKISLPSKINSFDEREHDLEFYLQN